MPTEALGSCITQWLLAVWRCPWVFQTVHNLHILSYSTTPIPSLNSLFFASHSSFFLTLSLVSAQLEQLFPVPQAKNLSAVLFVMPSTVLLPSKHVSSSA